LNLKIFAIFFSFFTLLNTLAIGSEVADKVVVIKSKATLSLLKDNRVLKKYHVVFGASPKGHKQQKVTSVHQRVIIH
jgi:murein L,D-transpeptidase YafK